jgi:hypothetical protein
MPTNQDYVAADFIAWGNGGAGATDETQLQSFINGAATQDPSLNNCNYSPPSWENPA